jgi:DNA-directed RNA polymerase sigma subunit (sigma70/sigma32)
VTLNPDDTELDALAAQARAVRQLDEPALRALVGRAHGGERQALRDLVEQQLASVLDAALAQRDTDLEVGELYQEGSIAAMVAVEEYVARDGRPAGLRDYVHRVVAAHLETVVERDKARRHDEERLLADAQLVEAAELVLRRELGRNATPTEVAARLDWPPERVEAIELMLGAAREIFDTEIALYLDDDEDRGQG